MKEFITFAKGKGRAVDEGEDEGSGHAEPPTPGLSTFPGRAPQETEPAADTQPTVTPATVSTSEVPQQTGPGADTLPTFTAGEVSVPEVSPRADPSAPAAPEDGGRGASPPGQLDKGHIQDED
ncbi:hypothetical protein HYPSUDRAFT_209508 [Hypholoma sublateritium FD-334 SS-4]|uniref:Uncharacterized protein n=1 Tax=Hypholoma sublateritium (strain FD-334 SS-4) TaxID=945553 RepID=A0A0D2N2K1_HYPSF|nr:hypothetical protein HYPSUDRAFT_209508 [Hypholoma sublateritium FD-334 SS-4]